MKNKKTYVFIVLKKNTTELEDEYLTDYGYNDLFDNFLNKELQKMTYDFKVE